MRYEIAVLLKALEAYRHRTGSYFPVDDAELSSALRDTKAAYEKGFETEHEETLVEISYVKKLLALATALTYADRGIAVALAALRFREQQEEDRDPRRPAFHITWLDERYKLLDFYGQLLDEEKDAMFQLALDLLRARGVLPPLPGDAADKEEVQSTQEQQPPPESGRPVKQEREAPMPPKRTPMDMQAALVLSVANKVKAVRGIRTVVIERQWSDASLAFSYFCWCVAEGKILDSFPTSELTLVTRWLADHGLSLEDRVWEHL